MTVSHTPDVLTTTSSPDTRAQQRQRFNWFAQKLERWVGYYDVDELLDFLHGNSEWPGQREKAIVLLALNGSGRALQTLRSLDLTGEDEAFRMLHEVALDFAATR